MAIKAAQLGIQTYSFRGFSGTAIIDQVRACGLSRVELCTMQADFSDPAALEKLIADYRKAGVAIDALGVHRCGGADDERVFAFARQAGAKVIGVDFAPAFSLDVFHAAERMAERFDLRLAIHNHGGYHWLGSAQMLELVFANTNERIGLCLDTAWAMHAGEDWLGLIERFGKRLYGLHVKDFTFAHDGKVEDVVIGKGNLRLAKLKKALDDVGFAGYAALEYEGQPENPGPAIRDCVAAAHKELCHV
jgi:sugar phosphate isomerase/epimerase